MSGMKKLERLADLTTELLYGKKSTIDLCKAHIKRIGKDVYTVRDPDGNSRDYHIRVSKNCIFCKFGIPRHEKK